MRKLTALIVTVAFLSGCTQKGAPTDTGVTKSLDAASFTYMLVAQGVGTFLRSGANLGLFTALYISQSGFYPVDTALRGIAAELQLHEIKSIGSDTETYNLLQEFGGILRTDIPDLLNRSSDRPQTLNDYLAGLDNITQRSQRKYDELKAAIEELQDEVKLNRDTVNDVQNSIRDALRDKDYAGAAALQPELGEAQGELSKVETQLKITQTAQQSYGTLLDVAKKRKLAIEANREVLIAGLGVVQLPGIEDLKILDNPNGGRTFGGGNGGGFFHF